jgi:hypothetical protein
MLERLLVFLFSIMLIVDSVNGLTMRAADFSVSAPFKGLLLVLVVLYLKRWVSVSLVLLVLLLFVFVHFFVLGDVVPAVSSSEMLFKCFSIVIFYWFFRRLLQDRDHHTVIYVLVVSIILMKLIVEARYFWYIAVGLISTMLSVLLATKVTILSVLLLFISFPFLSVVDRRLLNFRLSRKKFKFAALISVLFPAVVFSSVYILLYEINLIGRLEFFYSTADFVDVAMSGRNLLAADAWSIFSRDYSTIATFFGRGEYWDGSLDSSKLVEIDPVDILMTYGLIGLCLVYGFFTAIMVQVAGNVQHNPFGKYVLFTTVLLMGISFTAGHVVYSGTGGYLLAALLALGTLNSRRWLPAAQHSAVHWPGARQAG